MSELYQYFITTILLMATALFSIFLFYPRTPSEHIVDVQKDFIRTRNIMVNERKTRSSYDAATTSSVRSPTQPTSTTPSEPGAKYVVILTYQRCGSSFFGEIFNLNPGAFYAYEPLDSVYTALYGTVPGWNIPSDITNNRDGTARKIPEVESNAVTDFLRNLLTAQVDKLPTAALVHKFWTYFPQWHRQVKGFRSCLQRHKLVRSKCFGITTSYCGMKFGDKSPEQMEQCRRLIMNEINATTGGLEPETARIFTDYHSCFHSYRQTVDANCSEVLRKEISSRRVRAVKVVRATMSSMRRLLRAWPDLKIIHLVRDPRAVALSRLRFSPSVRGAYTRSISKKTGSRRVAEATLYCNHVTADIRSRLVLEREFPGRITLMRYEDVVTNPEQKFRDIYTLLDEPAPTTTLNRMKGLASKGQRRHLTTKWQRGLGLGDQTEIARLCSDYFQLLGISPDEFSNSSTTAEKSTIRR